MPVIWAQATIGIRSVEGWENSRTDGRSTKGAVGRPTMLCIQSRRTPDDRFRSGGNFLRSWAKACSRRTGTWRPTPIFTDDKAQAKNARSTAKC
jgi:hypothetical protein